MYGDEHGDEKVFDRLALDKRQALLLLASRLDRLDLWQHVRRITNVYGEGGVGCEFVADTRMLPALIARDDFTTRFASHAGAEAGYLERRRERGSLHLLLMDQAANVWSAHFDNFSPVASPRSACLHLWHERLRGKTPAWHEIADFDVTNEVSAEKQK